MSFRRLAYATAILAIGMPALVSDIRAQTQRAQDPQPERQAAQQSGDTGKNLRNCGLFNAEQLLARTFNLDEVGQDRQAGPYVLAARAIGAPGRGTQPEEADPRADVRQAPARGSILVKLTRPPTVPQDEWRSSYTFGAAQTERKMDNPGQDNPPRKKVGVGVFIKQHDTEHLILSVVVPDTVEPFRSDLWNIVPVVCSGTTHQLIGYGVVSVTAVSTGLAWTISIAVLVLFWLAITFASWQVNSEKLDRLWETTKARWTGWQPTPESERRVESVWKFFQATNPIFISQDSLGYGSLSRFQILVFTSVVGLVLLHIFVHSGVLSGMSNTVLMLLGITIAGGTFARAADDWAGVSASSRRFLLGENILKVRRDKPRFADLLETQGELDVAKVQALLFTSMVALAILASSVVGLETFVLPEQIVYLTALSQGAYVFGKLIPADSRKRIEQDLDQLRRAAQDVIGKPGDPQAMTVYEQARRTARSTLHETYLDRINLGTYDTVTATPQNAV
jgi:hypothetical protein